MSKVKSARRKQVEHATLRDQFAMAALTVVAQLPTIGQADEVGADADARAEMAYVYADAMLAARKKGAR